jgi:hypothetical protein
MTLPAPKLTAGLFVLALAPLAATALRQDTAASKKPVETPLVIDRFIQQEGRAAHVRFSFDDKELVIVGEAERPFVYREVDEATALWWTTLGSLRDAPELEFLVHEQGRRAAQDPDRDVLDLPDDYRELMSLALVAAELGSEVTARVNANAGDLDPQDPAHFRQLHTVSTLRPYLLLNEEGRLDLVIPATSTEGLWFDGEALGDGSEQRLGGLRLDLCFTARLDLVPDASLEWIETAFEGSTPYRPFVPEPTINDVRNR